MSTNLQLIANLQLIGFIGMKKTIKCKVVNSTLPHRYHWHVFDHWYYQINTVFVSKISRTSRLDAFGREICILELISHIIL